MSGKLQSWNASETLQTHSYWYSSERMMLLSFSPNSESRISNVGELLSRIFQNISYLESPLFICGLSQFHMHGIERFQVPPQISGNSSAGRRTFWNTRQTSPKCRVVLLTVHAVQACRFVRFPVEQFSLVSTLLRDQMQG